MVHFHGVPVVRCERGEGRLRSDEYSLVLRVLIVEEGYQVGDLLDVDGPCEFGDALADVDWQP